MKLEGKVAIVTGGARGLGKAFALRLSKEGARVVITDMLDSREVDGEILKAGGEALVLYTDVADEESAGEMADQAIERFGRIDILINNAGIFASLGKKPFYEISSGEWDEVMGVNLKGSFLCCKAVYPYMKKQGKGKIINISSGTFFSGVPFFMHYVASKGGIIAMTRVLALEAGDDGIRVNAVAPGLNLSGAGQGTDMYPAEYLKKAAQGRCLKRDEFPEDLTGTVLFLS